MKCQNCKKQFKKGEEAYFNGKVVCQKCYKELDFKRKYKPIPKPKWLSGIENKK